MTRCKHSPLNPERRSQLCCAELNSQQHRLHYSDHIMITLSELHHSVFYLRADATHVKTAHHHHRHRHPARPLRADGGQRHPLAALRDGAVERLEGSAWSGGRDPGGAAGGIWARVIRAERTETCSSARHGAGAAVSM